MELTYKVEENRQMSFFKIPKFLMTNPEFQKMSCEAKFIYGLMLDRLKLSIKNKWIDKDSNTFIIFQNSDIAKMIGCGVKKVINLVKELKTFGLISTKRVGLTKPNMIYVKQIFEEKKAKESDKKPLEKQNQEKANNKSSFKKSINNALNKAKNIGFNKSTKNAKNLETNNYDKYKDIIKENISYEYLAKQNPSEKDRVLEMVDIMAETLISTKKSLTISGNEIPIDLVKNTFLKLNMLDIEYILETLNNTHTDIKNIKAYLITVLYNSAKTRNNYYSQLANSNLYGGV